MRSYGSLQRVRENRGPEKSGLLIILGRAEHDIDMDYLPAVVNRPYT